MSFILGGGAFSLGLGLFLATISVFGPGGGIKGSDEARSVDVVGVGEAGEADRSSRAFAFAASSAIMSFILGGMALSLDLGFSLVTISGFGPGGGIKGSDGARSVDPDGICEVGDADRSSRAFAFAASSAIMFFMLGGVALSLDLGFFFATMSGFGPGGGTTGSGGVWSVDSVGICEVGDADRSSRAFAFASSSAIMFFMLGGGAFSLDLGFFFTTVSGFGPGGGTTGSGGVRSVDTVGICEEGEADRSSRAFAFAASSAIMSFMLGGDAFSLVLELSLTTTSGFGSVGVGAATTSVDVSPDNAGSATRSAAASEVDPSELASSAPGVVSPRSATGSANGRTGSRDP